MCRPLVTDFKRIIVSQTDKCFRAQIQKGGQVGPRTPKGGPLDQVGARHLNLFLGERQSREMFRGDPFKKNTLYSCVDFDNKFHLSCKTGVSQASP